jgi:hypothetical protein
MMGRIFWQLVATLLLVGFVCAYFWWIVAALAAVGLLYFGRALWLAERRLAADREAEHRRIAQRADQQHAWVMQGDPRGTYGA